MADSGPWGSGTGAPTGARAAGAQRVRTSGNRPPATDMTEPVLSPPATRSGGPSETTRYLCAAAYLDREFTEKVLTEVFDERYRFVAPSYGVDIVTVIKHCLVARRRNLMRDALLAAIAVAGLVSLGSGSFGFVALLILAAWAVVFFDELSRRHGLLGGKLARGRFRVEDVDAPVDAAHRERLAELAQEHDGNVSVYSGFVPFVGSGFDLDGWSFTVDTSRPDSKLTRTRGPQPFTAEEIHDHVAGSLRALAFSGLTVSDRLYVNGRDIRNDERFLNDPFSRPYSTVSPALVRSLIGKTDGVARHYLSVRIVGWDGELVVTLFVRFCMSGRNLFAEASYFLLPSLRAQYHKVDEVTATPTPRQVLELLRSTVPLTLAVGLAAPFRVVHAALASFQRGAALRAATREIKENPRFDYGAKTSIRQSGTAPNFHHYFQKLDKEMIVKIVERELLDSIVQFLEARGVDTSDLKEKTNVIENHGVIVTGGSVQTESLAVGKQARVTLKRKAAAAPAAAPPS